MASSGQGNDDNLTDSERMSMALEEKKNLLVERKKRYSELTSAQYSANQELIRMQKALKNQMANINAATKKYVDNNANLALAEADCEYFKSKISSHGEGFDQKQELDDIGISREHLKQKLKDFRDLKVKINEQRNTISTQNQSLRQECLSVGFYCKDIRAKMDADLKKHIDRQKYDSQNGPKKHIRDTNKSAMIVANRVLDCREEVLGFFKQQVLKVKREERLAEEERDMLAEKLKTSKENSQAITENEVENFVKKQKIFPNSSDDNTNENNEPPNDATSTKPLQPKPPPKEAPSAVVMAMSSATLMGRANLLGSTARQRRKERNSVFSAVNIDRIGEDLIRGCETEGNTTKLRALKLAMRHHVLQQLSFILMLENELNAEKVVCEQQRRESLEESVLYSLLSEDQDGTNPVSSIGVEQEGPVAPRLSTAHNNVTKTADGQFGRHMGKLCGLNSADITNDESYVSNGNLYVNMLAADVTKVESELRTACDATSEMLYRTCIDGISDPWDPAVLSNIINPQTETTSEEQKTEDIESTIEHEQQTKKNNRVSVGYRTQALVLESVRSSEVTSSQDKSKKKEKKIEKSFGLLKWLTVGKFEDKLAQILTNEVKTMNDIPIELGLAKLTSINHTAKQISVTQVAQQKERERQTLAIALKDISHTNPEASLPQITPVQEKKVTIMGLEKL